MNGSRPLRVEPVAEKSPSAPAETEPAAPEPVTLRMPIDIRSVSLTLIAILAVVFILRYAEAMIIPLVLGVLIKYALDPVVERLVRFRVPRGLAAALVLLSVVGAGSVMIYQLRFQADAIVQRLPEAARRLRHTMERDRGNRDSTIEKMQEAATELEKAAEATATQPKPGVTRVQIEQPPVDVGQYLMWSSASVATALGQAILILFLAYFLLASGDLYRRKLVKIVPSFAQKKITVQILDQIDRQIGSFLLVQAFTSVVVGVVSWLAFRWIGLEQAALWGLLAGLFNSIPYFGPVIVTSAIGIVAFLQFGTITMSIWAGAVAFGITTLEGMLLTPWLNSRAARMNAAAVFVGLLFWGWVWEIWGLLLAVPLLMAIKTVCDHIDDFKPVSEILGE